MVYCGFVILLMPIFAIGYQLDNSVNSVETTSLMHSYCNSLLLVAFIVLTMGWIYEYYILLMVLRRSLNKEHKIENS